MIDTHFAFVLCSWTGVENTEVKNGDDILHSKRIS